MIKKKNSNKRNCQLTDTICVIESRPLNSIPDTGTLSDDSDILTTVVVLVFFECDMDRELHNENA